MSVFQFLRPMFLKMIRCSSGCAGCTAGFGGGSDKSDIALSGCTFSCRSSLIMQTGAVPQLARHSTNSMLYFAPGLTEIGVCPAAAGPVLLATPEPGEGGR